MSTTRSWPPKTNLWAACLCGLLGCAGAASSPPTDTGARKVAEAYVQAILAGDWADAYACLHFDSQTTLPADRFASVARAYRDAFGFEPEGVTVRSCEEHGDEAIAHVVFRGRSHSGQRYYKDGVVLRCSDLGWRVLVPSNFGLRRERRRH
jgi:hypothetical protein